MAGFGRKIALVLALQQVECLRAYRFTHQSPEENSGDKAGDRSKLAPSVAHRPVTNLSLLSVNRTVEPATKDAHKKVRHQHAASFHAKAPKDVAESAKTVPLSAPPKSKEVSVDTPRAQYLSTYEMITMDDKQASNSRRMLAWAARTLFSTEVLILLVVFKLLVLGTQRIQDKCSSCDSDNEDPIMATANKSSLSSYAHYSQVKSAFSRPSAYVEDASDDGSGDGAEEEDYDDHDDEHDLLEVLDDSGCAELEHKLMGPLAKAAGNRLSVLIQNLTASSIHDKYIGFLGLHETDVEPSLAWWANEADYEANAQPLKSILLKDISSVREENCGVGPAAAVGHWRGEKHATVSVMLPTAAAAKEFCNNLTELLGKKTYRLVAKTSACQSKGATHRSSGSTVESRS